MREYFPGLVFARFNVLANAFHKISETKELFPDPETPVTHINSPNGNSTSISFRLCSAAP